MSVDVFRRIRLRESVSVPQQIISFIRALLTSLFCQVLLIFWRLRGFYASYPVFKLSDGFPLCSVYFEQQMHTNISLFRPYLGEISSGFFKMASRIRRRHAPIVCS